LDGKVALVTGASKGIGRAVALALHKNGAHVIAAARPSKDLESLKIELGDRGEIWASDATSNEFLSQIAVLERLDILVNNLGTARHEPFIDVSDENLDVVLDMNVRVSFRIARESVKRMTEGGCVVHVTSQMGHIGSPNRTVYCMTKHALEGLSKAMAVELAPQGIRSNCVAPTFVETPLTKPMLAKPEFRAFVEGMIPMGHVAKTEDIAQAVIYLAEAKMVTGTSLLVDGGWTAR